MLPASPRLRRRLAPVALIGLVLVVPLWLLVSGIRRRRRELAEHGRRPLYG
jgi:hypothetical protein